MWESSEPTLTIEPPAARCGAVARATRKLPVRLAPRCAAQSGVVGVGERRRDSDAGAVDDDVEAAEALDRRRDRGGDLARIGDVGDQRQGDVAELGGQRLERLAAAGEQRHRRAGLGEAPRRGGADPGGGAGDQRDLAGEGRGGRAHAPGAGGGVLPVRAASLASGRRAGWRASA